MYFIHPKIKKNDHRKLEQNIFSHLPELFYFEYLKNLENLPKSRKRRNSILRPAITFIKNVIHKPLNFIQSYSFLQQTLPTKAKISQKTKKELQAKSRLEKQITANLNHELKTPLTLALNHSNLLAIHLEKFQEKRTRMSPGDLETLRQSQMNISRSLQRMNDVCNSIFTLYELETHQNTGTIHPLKNLPLRLQQLAEFFETKAQAKDLRFKYIFCFQDKECFGGGMQFEQVLRHLLDNALKYTFQGEITIKVEQTSKYLYAIVRDTGIGVPPHKRKTIFRKFYRERNEKNDNLSEVWGLGLGLYIVHRLLKSLSGRIKVQDNPEGFGTEFIVKIPIYTSRRRQQRGKIKKSFSRIVKK